MHERGLPSSAVGRRPELDGLRGIAILLVLASHAHVPGFSREGGFVGVTLFFVLSGYLITSILLAEQSQTGRVDLRAFYMRRGLRLFPALAALLLVVILASALGIRPGPPISLGPAIAAVVAYIGNWYQVLGHPLGTLGHTWSLAVEEQFYIAWPALLLLAMTVARPARIGLAVLAVALLVTPWRVVLLLTNNYTEALVGTDAHADALLAGCAIALLGTRMDVRWGWAAVVGLIAADVVWPDGTLAAPALGLPLAALLAWIAVAACPSAMRWAPLAYVGRISYGLYLWHYLVISSSLPWPLILAVSLGIAIVSYHLLEAPFLRLKDRVGRPSLYVGAGLTLEPVAVAYERT